MVVYAGGDGLARPIPFIESTLVTDVGDRWVLRADTDGMRVTCTDVPEWTWSASTPQEAQALLNQVLGSVDNDGTTLVQRLFRGVLDPTALSEVAATTVDGRRVGRSPHAVQDFLDGHGIVVNSHERTWLAASLLMGLALWPEGWPGAEFWGAEVNHGSDQ